MPQPLFAIISIDEHVQTDGTEGESSSVGEGNCRETGEGAVPHRAENSGGSSDGIGDVKCADGEDGGGLRSRQKRIFRNSGGDVSQKEECYVVFFFVCLCR